MLKNRMIYALLIMGLFLFYLYCNSYIALLALELTVILTVISGVLAFISSRKLTARVSRSGSSADPMNRRIEFCFVLENASSVPAPLVRFVTNIGDLSEAGEIRRKMVTSLSSFDERRIYATFAAPYAALVRADVRELRVCDCFGVFSFPAPKRTAQLDLLISPAEIAEGKMYTTSRRSIPDSDIYSDTQKGDDRSQVFELREYAEGDDLRNVHWAMSTKHDMLIVKEFSKPIEESCTVLIESSLFSNDPPGVIKRRADRVLANFVALISQLIAEGQPTEVCFYSESAGRLCAFEVKKYEDAAAVMKAYLSEKLPGEPMLTYKSYTEKYGEGTAAYYIYDSSAVDIGGIKSRSTVTLIDASEGEAGDFED